MSEIPFNPDSYCGLYCGSCMLYLATKNNQIEAYTKKISTKTEERYCHGCKTNRITGWCLTCPIKACARKKGFNTCSTSPEFPCEQLNDFQSDPDYPYHVEIFKSLDFRKHNGYKNWLDSQKTRWSCPNCKKEFGWYNLECSECKSTVNGYVKP